LAGFIVAAPIMFAGVWAFFQAFRNL